MRRILKLVVVLGVLMFMMAPLLQGTCSGLRLARSGENYYIIGWTFVPGSSREFYAEVTTSRGEVLGRDHVLWNGRIRVNIGSSRPRDNSVLIVTIRNKEGRIVNQGSLIVPEDPQGTVELKTTGPIDVPSTHIFTCVSTATISGLTPSELSIPITGSVTASFALTEDPSIIEISFVDMAFSVSSLEVMGVESGINTTRFGEGDQILLDKETGTITGDFTVYVTNDDGLFAYDGRMSGSLDLQEGNWTMCATGSVAAMIPQAMPAEYALFAVNSQAPQRFERLEVGTQVAQPLVVPLNAIGTALELVVVGLEPLSTLEVVLATASSDVGGAVIPDVQIRSWHIAVGPGVQTLRVDLGYHPLEGGRTYFLVISSNTPVDIEVGKEEEACLVSESMNGSWPSLPAESPLAVVVRGAVEMSWNVTGQRVIAEVLYDTLVATDAQGIPIPSLATSWDISEDLRTVTLNLREGVKFHDGTNFDASTAVLSLQKPVYLLPNWQRQPIVELGLIEHIEIVDNLSLRVFLTAPLPGMLLRLLDTPYGMISAPSSISEDTLPIGTGPFKEVTWDENSEVHLDPYLGYWGDLVETEGIIFRVVPDEQVRRLLLETGEVHGVVENSVVRYESLLNSSIYDICGEPYGFMVVERFGETSCCRIDGLIPIWETSSDGSLVIAVPWL